MGTKTHRVLRELAKGTLVLVALVLLRFALWHPGRVEGVTQFDLAIVFLSELFALQWGPVAWSRPDISTFDFIKDALFRTFAYMALVMGTTIAVAPWLQARRTNGIPSNGSRIVAAAAVLAASIPVFCLFYLILFPVWIAYDQNRSLSWLDFIVDHSGQAAAIGALAISGLGAAYWHVRCFPATGGRLAPLLRFFQMRLGELFTWVFVVDWILHGGVNAGASFFSRFVPLWLRHYYEPLIWAAFAIAVGVASLYTVIGVALALLDEDPDAAGLIPPPAAPPGPP